MLKDVCLWVFLLLWLSLSDLFEVSSWQSFRLTLSNSELGLHDGRTLWCPPQQSSGVPLSGVPTKSTHIWLRWNKYLVSHAKQPCLDGQKCHHLTPHTPPHMSLPGIHHPDKTFALRDWLTQLWPISRTSPSARLTHIAFLSHSWLTVNTI